MVEAEVCRRCFGSDLIGTWEEICLHYFSILMKGEKDYLEYTLLLLICHLEMDEDSMR